MWRTYFTVMFMTRNGVWVELPRTECVTIVQELVATLLKCMDIEGEAIKVIRSMEQGDR